MRCVCTEDGGLCIVSAPLAAKHEQTQVANQLVDLYKETNGLAWVNAWVDGQHLPAAPRGVCACLLACMYVCACVRVSVSE